MGRVAGAAAGTTGAGALGCSRAGEGGAEEADAGPDDSGTAEPRRRDPNCTPTLERAAFAGITTAASCLKGAFFG